MQNNNIEYLRKSIKKIKLKFIIFFSFVISIFICFFIGNITEYFIFLESMEK